MNLDDLVGCVINNMKRHDGELRRLLRSLLSSPSEVPWSRLEWQRAKYIIARGIAECFCKNNCRVYLLEMHGGEPSDGLGDKDIDMAIDCPGEKINIDFIENILEKYVTKYLSGLIGGEVRRELKIPNVVELHTSDEFLIKKHLEARDKRYAIKIC
ncbi:hypothetical protein PYJP_16220 [Pyrofollis japonicus]|uniref:hypothetical protein n=1 Tax=Pyrofollis japonicus TaxID=3060460 RepID=UPI00295AF5E0|nr:hypothetical protein [Pyrofollis japonicus]BEP18270.1 hypothetical protein PYJP_16220 [Pyrofollis japonicus]